MKQLPSIEKASLYLLRDLGVVADDRILDRVAPDGTVVGRCACPFHGGDNPCGLCLYQAGWACHKGCHHAEPKLGANLVGLFRRLAHKLTGRVMAWDEAVRYVKANKAAARELFAGKVARVRAVGEVVRPAFGLDELLACLEVPSPYYIARGYLPETLRAFGVGDARSPLPDGRRPYECTVVPVLGPTGDLRGYTVRQHRPSRNKWWHVCKKGEVLYNAHSARGHDHLFVVESPGNAMRLYEAGFPGVVATLGGAVSESQYFIFLSLLHPGLRRVVIVADNDASDVGMGFARKTADLVRGVCLAEPEIELPPAGRKDIGDCTVEEVRAALG